MALAGLAVRELNAAWGPVLHITFLAGALILLASILSSDGFRPRLNSLVSRHFFSAKYDYRREWLRFSETLSADAEKAPIEERILSAILESVACRSGGLWLRQEDERGFVIAAAKPSELLYSEEPCKALSALMAERDGLTALTPRGVTQIACEELNRCGPVRRPWAAIPLRHRGHLEGFLVLAEPLGSREPDSEDGEFLQVLCVQAAAHLTEERSAIAADRARRFETSARQLTYIGHDLKNIVSQFSMVLQNWSRHRTNEGFLAELPGVLGGAVERMKSLLAGLRAGIASQSERETIDVRQCLVGLLPLWRARYEHFVIDLDPTQVVAQGRREEMQSIFDQLVMNAIEASDGTGDVTVKTWVDDRYLIVQISDQGAGISEKSVVGSRFHASDSSKSGGYGVGLFQVRDYVRRFRGNLSFTSARGAGTIARLTLPIEILPQVAGDRPTEPRGAAVQPAFVGSKEVVISQ